MPPSRTQSQLLKLYQAENAEKTRLAHKRRYQRVIGIGLGAVGLAAAMVGMPFAVSVALWAMGAISWRILKAV